jgi:PAS domain-containing protein
MEQEENALLSARTTQFEKSSQAVHFVLVALIALAGLLVLLIAAFIASYLSERRRAEQALVHLATIVESSDDAILSIKPDGIIVSWNPAAERLYGYAAQEILGQSALRLVPPERKSELDEIVDKINKGGYRRSKC